MSEETTTSVDIGKDVSGSIIVAGEGNVTNVTITQHVTQPPPSKPISSNPRPKSVSKMCDRDSMGELTR